MPLKDLSGKTVSELEPEDFEKLFCQQCKEYQSCSKEPNITMKVCQALIDSGLWYKLNQK